MHYNFYFDETFHDRKITINSSGVINTFTEDKNDSYIGVFWGIKNDKRSSVIKKVNNLEKNYIERYGLTGEFKSTTIHKKNFKLGIYSFNRDAYDFYLDFFGMLENISPIIHVNVVSKIEFLVRNIFDANKLKCMLAEQTNTFYYSITKFIIIYHSPQLIQALYESGVSDNGKLFQKELLNHLEKAIYILEGIERKEREIPALKHLYRIVACYNFDKCIALKYDFVYFQNFDGLKNLLTDLKVSLHKVNLTLDNEEETYRAASNYGFNSIKQSNSLHSIQIRVADHLCGFIGRMMHALMDDKLIKEDPVNDINRLSENNLSEKHLLSPDWFNLQQKHFILYKQIYKVLIQQQSFYWSVMAWSYADQVSMFYTLLRYIADYDSFNDFKKKTPEEHTECYNLCCCNELERQFVSM